MSSRRREMVPPDGGWGWVVCLAFAMNNIITIPVILCFGLIFQKVLHDRDISNTNAMIILSFNHAFGMLFSLWNRRLFNSYGYRKVAIVCSLFVPIGILLTSGANTTVLYILTFSLFTCTGMYTLPASFNSALNVFFKIKYKIAKKLVLLFTGLGAIFMPHLIFYLMSLFGDKEAMMILSALCMNSLVAACLLRPVKSYLRPVKIQDIKSVQNGTVKSNLPLVEVDLNDISDSGEYLSESENAYLDEKYQISIKSFDDNMDNEVDRGSNLNTLSKPYRWWSTNSIEVNLQSSLDIFNDRGSGFMKIESNPDLFAVKSVSLPQTENETLQIPRKQLLKYIRLLNVVGGLSLSLSTEIAFSLTIPFMMRDFGMDTYHIATIMTVIYASEFVFKFTSPMIEEWCHKSTRIMFYMSLWMLIFSRTFFLLTSRYESLLVVAVGYGIAKGVNSIYINLVIPSYKIKGKIISSSTVQMFTTAFLLILFGPVIGHISDVYKSFNISIILVNIVTLLAIILWSLEYLLVKIKFL